MRHYATQRAAPGSDCSIHDSCSSRLRNALRIPFYSFLIQAMSSPKTSLARGLVLLFLFLSGCAMQQTGKHEQTENMLAMANFTAVPAGSAAIADTIAQLAPYDLTALPAGRKSMKFYFHNPKSQIVWVGDMKAYERYGAIGQQMAVSRGQQTLQQHEQTQLRSDQNRLRWAQFGQAIAMGAAQAGQNMQQQYAYVPQPQQPMVARSAPRSAQQLPAGGVMGRFNPQNPMSEYASPIGRYNRNNPMSEYSSPTGSLNPNNPMSEVSSPMGRYNPNNPMSEISSPMGRLNPNNPISEVSSPMGAFNPNNPMGQGVHPVYYQGR
jgi:hypothetical protein